MGGDDDWRAANLAWWDERVPLHLRAGRVYDPAPLRAATARLDAIAEAELGPVAGLRVLHLQCHIGGDTLVLALKGAAAVVGLDFSAPAVAAALGLAAELGLEGRARFVVADLYDAPAVLAAEAGSFDRVFVTWGALNWLPDLEGWARIVALFLRPGGRLYLAEQHPAAFALDDAAAGPEGRPGWFLPYFQQAPLITEEGDYHDPAAEVTHRTIHVFPHTLATVIGALRSAGLALDWLREHPRVPWPMFRCLVEDADGMWTWPDRPWWPLGFSLEAVKG